MVRGPDLDAHETSKQADHRMQMTLHLQARRKTMPIASKR